MAEVSLTRGAIATITEGGATAEGLKPILQVTEVRLVGTTQTTTERYRMMLSDGVSQQQAMLATPMNSMVKSGQLQKGSVVQLTEHVCNTIHGRRIIIIISLEVLDKSDAIGAPKIYDSGSTMSQNHAPMPAQSSGMVQPSAAGSLSSSAWKSLTRVMLLGRQKSMILAPQCHRTMLLCLPNHLAWFNPVQLVEILLRLIVPAV